MSNRGENGDRGRKKEGADEKVAESALDNAEATVVQNSQELGFTYWATCLSIRSYRSLIRLFRTAPFARAIRCASFGRSLTHSLPSSWESGWLLID